MRISRLQAIRLGLAVIAVGLMLLPSPVAAQPQAEASKVRVLLVLDTDDSMGATWGLDGENVKALIENMVAKQGLQGRVTIDHFTGAMCTAKKVLDYYNALDTNPDEALFFYYSGHGGYHKDKGHFMAFTRGQLFRNDLLKAMDKRKPRLRVVLTDCCANIIGQPIKTSAETFGGTLDTLVVFKDDSTRRPPVDEPRGPKSEPPSQEFPIFGKPRKTMPLAKREEPKFTVGRGVDIRLVKGKVAFDTLLAKTDGKVLRELLFRERGLIDINGCKVGAVSMGTLDWGGSVFTNTFIVLQTEQPSKLGAKNNNDFVSWESFFPRWVQVTEQFSRAYTNGKMIQSPQAFQLGEKK